MSNPFFTWTFDVAPGSSNKSKQVENEFAAIGTGFDSAYAYLLRGLFAPTDETMTLLPSRNSRKNKGFWWDANGDPSAEVIANQSEMAAAVAAAAAAADSEAAAAASAASLSAVLSSVAANIVEVTDASVNASAGTHYILIGGLAQTVVLPAAPTVTHAVMVTVGNGRRDNAIDSGSKKVNGAAPGVYTASDIYTNVLAIFSGDTYGWSI